MRPRLSAAFWIPFVACGGAPTLDGCATGWWLDSSMSCAAACPGQPECSASDCRLMGILGLLANRSSRQGFVTSSKERGSLSALGPIMRSTWSVTDDKLRISEGSMPIAATCTSASLEIGIGSRDRAPSNISAALEKAAATDEWISVPVAP